MTCWLIGDRFSLAEFGTNPVAPIALAGIDGLIGLFHQIIKWPGKICSHAGHPDTASDVNDGLVFRQGNARASHPLAQMLGYAYRALEIGFRQQDDELLAAETGDEISRAGMLIKHPGYLLKDQIADQMAVIPTALMINLRAPIFSVRWT